MDIQPAAQKLIESGVLGALLIVVGVASVIVIRTLFALLITEKDKRLADALKFNDGLLTPIDQIKKNGETQITLLQQVLQKFTKV